MNKAESIEARITSQLSGADAQTMRALYRAPKLRRLDPLDPLVKKLKKSLTREIQNARSARAAPLAGIAAMGLYRSHLETL
jgi:ABC-type Fe3+/spermidine/putrescine transport system ATPase subunit